ncbi:hypothetical protein [Paraburkholderia phosphatilytica]|uniref:hypothetical protein n=1 Tax=Paraburkholderia phosphatilytica TaxID=2282883 RepID=UPI000F5E40A3|nr:hypothetical protein [Paraburkholderia phosphatilytica]
MSSIPPETSLDAASNPPPDLATIMATLASRLDLDVTQLVLSEDQGRVIVTGTLPLRRMVHQVQTLIETQPDVRAAEMRVDVVTQDFAEAERRQQADRRDASEVVKDERDRQTGHEI